MFYSDKRLLSEYAISVAMRWQCCDKFTAQSYKQDLRTWKAQMPGRWCVRHSSNRYTATHILRAEIPVSSVPTPNC